MADVVSAEVRSRMMSGIRGKDTKPELLVRRQLHARGFRFRLHDQRLPGKPDIFLPRYQAVIFINGCFWHGHNCRFFKMPKTNVAFWSNKIARNVERDNKNLIKIRDLGLKYLVVWECETRQDAHSISKFLDEIAAWIKN